MSAISASQDSADGSDQDEPPSRPGTRQVTLPVSTHAIASLPRGSPGSRRTERPPDGPVFFTKAHVSRTEAVFSQSDTGRRPVLKLRARRSCEPLSLNRTVWRCPFSVQRPEVPSRKSLGSESCSLGGPARHVFTEADTEHRDRRRDPRGAWSPQCPRAAGILNTPHSRPSTFPRGCRPHPAGRPVKTQHASCSPQTPPPTDEHEGRDLRAVRPETASNKAPCRPLPGSPRTNAPAANCDGAGAELQAAVLPGDGAPDQRPDSLDP